MKISIINVAGKKIHEEIFYSNELNINTSKLEKGIYIVHIQANKTKKTFRVIKK